MLYIDGRFAPLYYLLRHAQNYCYKHLTVLLLFEISNKTFLPLRSNMHGFLLY
jgi:hypothetical protein